MIRQTSHPESLSELVPEEAAPSFKAVQLRILMKECEDAAARLVELDHAIWTLEEYFRETTD